MSTFMQLAGLIAGCFLYEFAVDGLYLRAAEHSFWIVVGGGYVALCRGRKSS